MNISRELIIRFFNKECTAEEAEAVSDFLRENPGAAEELLPEKEWEQISGSAGRPDAYWQEVWQQVRPAGKTRVVPMWRKLAAAAVLAGAVAMAWYWAASDRLEDRQATAAAYEGRELINGGTSVMQYMLEDSSVVELSAGAQLRYDPAFANGRRDMQLTGEALFRTKGDAGRPFSVYSNGIAVTALGTVFRVASAAGEGSLSVALLEGKVVVRSVDTSLALLDQDYYLLPGDEFNYSRENGIALLRKQPAKPAPEAGKPDAAPGEKRDVNNWYMFENQGLAQVFEQLGAIYGERIYYNPADLRGLNFIGKIDHTDTLDNILRDIAMLNNLRVVKNKKGYVIKAQ